MKAFIKDKIPARKLSDATKDFIVCISADYPDFSFNKGQREHWSPKSNTITFNPSQTPEHIRFGVLHELSHALLGHTTYHSDFELLKKESEAWHLASEIGLKYGVTISEDHIQNCLDTYRDWLHQRSQCPACGMHALQRDSRTYKCFNCAARWRVSSGRFVRPYRKTINK
ncbi:ImmA/IrrE family metallo-endopeptidase [Candidatus Saccharibacteria bacterium]|nr:ImmA/IrrE family metallo-endopeptidase [Candidatus Saccharibacteria bacterium]